MKNLLVAIDFSRNSIQALEYALMYADRFKADISLIWVDNSVGPDLMVERTDGESRYESRELLKEIIDKYQRKFKKRNISFNLRKGKVYEEISKQAKKISADLIFAGTHGITGFEKYWIGSNAYRIVTHAPCPVITLRQDFKFDRSVKNILLPIDGSKQSSNKVKVTADIAEAFGAEVQVLALHTSKLGSLRRQVDKHLGIVKKHLDKNNINHIISEVSTKNLTQDTIDFAAKNEVDLIAIMTEQETTQANVFLGTFARQLVNNCPVPVLSIRTSAVGKI